MFGNRFSCQIIGLLAAKGQGAMGMNQDDLVLMPLKTVQRRLSGNQDISTILIGLRDGVEASSAMQRIRSLMRERRKLDEKEDDDFNMMDNHNYTVANFGLVHNSGKRNGSIAVYLEPWHADVEGFLDLRKPHVN
jgi:putative ABC transport system permease protein